MRLQRVDTTECDILKPRPTIHEHRISLYEFRSTMDSFNTACDFTILNLHIFIMFACLIILVL